MTRPPNQVLIEVLHRDAERHHVLCIQHESVVELRLIAKAHRERCQALVDMALAIDATPDDEIATALEDEARLHQAYESSAASRGLGTVVATVRERVQRRQVLAAALRENLTNAGHA